MKIVRSI